MNQHQFYHAKRQSIESQEPSESSNGIVESLLAKYTPLKDFYNRNSRQEENTEQIAA